jgi:membrane dipeptidase
MLIVDAHLDLSWNALQWNRDLARSVYTIRAQENTTPGKGRGTNTVAFPEMRSGRVALSFATLLARSTGQPVPYIDYASPAQAYGIARGQMHYYDALERQGDVCIVRDRAELKQCWDQWVAWEEAGAEGATPPLGFVISMEGADPIQQPEQLEEWYNLGLRLLGITHYGYGRYAGGTATDAGLTALGPSLLQEMERLGILLDLTHCSDPAFWEALEHYNGLVLASHNNARALVPTQRQFSDAQLRAVIERDGVIGAAFDAWMLKPGWQIVPRPDPFNPLVTLADVVDQIDYVCQLAGNSRHAALGTDLDGGFGREQSPSDLDTIADLQRIPDMLAQRGYAADDIGAIMHGNWLRLLDAAWSAQPLTEGVEGTL